MENWPLGNASLPARFDGYTVLVVGGSGGIGRAIAAELSRQGAHLRIHGRDPQRTARLVNELRHAGGSAEAEIVAFDPSQALDSAVDSLLAGTVPDIVVVSYGPFIERPVWQTESGQWRELFEANVMLPVMLGRRCLPEMLRRGFGRMLVFGGSGTERIAGFRTIAAYSAVKTALMSWVKSAARETAGSNVVVAALCPGYVATEYVGPDALERYARRSAGGRLAKPEEVARVAVSLLDPNSSLINGAVVPIDSGGHG